MREHERWESRKAQLLTRRAPKNLVKEGVRHQIVRSSHPVTCSNKSAKVQKRAKIVSVFFETCVRRIEGIASVHSLYGGDGESLWVSRGFRPWHSECAEVWDAFFA